VSTPTTLGLPHGVRRTIVDCARGTFAALEAAPPGGAGERGTSLLVPGYTGSKEDFIPILGPLAADGRRVLAVDLRGQYQTSGPDDPAAYALPELGADIAALARATAAAHLLGHSLGGLVAREAVLSVFPRGGSVFPRGDDPPGDPPVMGGPPVPPFPPWPTSLTLMCSGPAALPGDGVRAADVRSLLDYVAGAGPRELPGKIAEIWHGILEPQAVDSGLPDPIRAFLGERMLANNPTGFVTMARQLLTVEDQTADLANRDIATFVLYGENDNAWPPEVQEDMAHRLQARRACIPGAAHSPAVEAPAATAYELTSFWNAAEGI
jgi:pimeloyl-ACP methyl ester carboxylesterase